MNASAVELQARGARARARALSRRRSARPLASFRVRAPPGLSADSRDSRASGRCLECPPKKSAPVSEGPRDGPNSRPTRRRPSRSGPARARRRRRPQARLHDVVSFGERALHLLTWVHPRKTALVALGGACAVGVLLLAPNRALVAAAISAVIIWWVAIRI